MKEFKNENSKLRRELEEIKSRIKKAVIPIKKKETYTQTPSYSSELISKKDKRIKDREKEKSVSKTKRNSQLVTIERWNKNKKIRRELNYPLGSGKYECQEELSSVFIEGSGKIVQEESIKKRNTKESNSEKRNSIRMLGKDSVGRNKDNMET